MGTKTTEEIIDRGTAKQKACLYLRDRVALLPEGTDFLLSKGEPEELLKSVDPSQITEFNRILSWGLRVEAGISGLYVIISEYRVSVEKFKRALEYRDNLCRTEDIVNLSLMDQTDQRTALDPEYPKSDLSLFAREIGLINTETQEERIKERNNYIADNPLIREIPNWRKLINPEGYLDFKEKREIKSPPFHVWREIVSHRGEISLLFELYITREEAIKRFIANGTKVPEIPEYEEIMDKYKSILLEEYPERDLRSGTKPAIRSLLATESELIPDKELDENAINDHYNTL